VERTLKPHNGKLAGFVVACTALLAACDSKPPPNLVSKPAPPKVVSTNLRALELISPEFMSTNFGASDRPLRPWSEVVHPLFQSIRSSGLEREMETMSDEEACTFVPSVADLRLASAALDSAEPWQDTTMVDRHVNGDTVHGYFVSLNGAMRWLRITTEKCASLTDAQRHEAAHAQLILGVEGAKLLGNRKYGFLDAEVLGRIAISNASDMLAMTTDPKYATLRETLSNWKAEFEPR
jgi:hypothetical protein